MIGVGELFACQGEAQGSCGRGGLQGLGHEVKPRWPTIQSALARGLEVALVAEGSTALRAAGAAALPAHTRTLA